MKRPLTTALLVVLSLSAEAADPGPLTLTPQPADPDRPWTLSWESSPGTLYQVERATNLAESVPWRFEDAVVASSRASKINVPGRTSAGGAEFWRVSLTPRLLDLQPAFLNPADPDAALELFGQGLPTNATVRLNGQPVPSSSSPNPEAWRLIRAADLPPGLTDIRSVTVLAGSNVIATLHLYLPIALGAVPPPELLQGPAPEPPASPRLTHNSLAARQKKWLTSNFRVRLDGPTAAARLGLGTPNFLDEDHDQDGLMESPAKQKAWLTSNFRCRLTSHKTEDCDDEDRGVFPANGELRLQQVDLALPGPGPGFAWVRTYRSRTGPDSPLGAGWDFSYNVSLTPQTDGTLLLRPGNGRADTFYPTATNTWVRDEYFCEVRDLDADGMPDVLFADTSRWLFQPPGSPAAGRLRQIIDRHGNTVSLDYDAAGRLTAVIDDLGRTHLIEYNAAGRIAGVHDAAGRSVRYEHDTDGNLTAVVSPAVTGTPTGNDFPGGLTNRFAYSKGFPDSRLNHNLVASTDPRGQTWMSVSYHPATDPASLNFDTVSRITRGTASEDWTRTDTADAKAVAVWVRDATGNVSESIHDRRGRCLRLRQYTGRAPDLNAPVTETDNRPVNPLRTQDPAFFETRWTWNRDSLCTLEVRPDAGRTLFIHEADLRPDAGARHRGNLRVVRQIAGDAGGGDLDGDGKPDYTELAWRLDYDARFGSPPAASDVPSLASHLHRVGIIHRDLAARNHLLDGRSDHHLSTREVQTKTDVHWTAGPLFVTSETEPDGTVHTATYDAQGNQTGLRAAVQAAANPPALDFAYNSRGQLTAVTNAPDDAGRRRVDLLAYDTAGCLQTLTRDAANPALASLLRLECDNRGNVTRLVDPRGSDTLFSYNALDQCVRTQSPTNLSARCVTDLLYDPNGNLVETRAELRDANDVLQHPVRTLAEYDFLDRCTALSRQTAPGAFVTERFTHDPDGRLHSILSPLAASGDEPDNQVQIEYDERGLLYRVIHAPGSPLGLTNTFSYSREGRGSRLSVRSTDGPSDAHLYERDGFGRVVRITDPMGNVTSLARNRAGQITRSTATGEPTDADGDAGNVRLAQIHWRYDALGRCTLEDAAFFDPATQAPLDDGARTTTFAYAPNGALLKTTDDQGGVTRLAYDPAGRLASITDPKTNVLSFAYDPADAPVALQSDERSDLSSSTTTFRTTLVRDAWGRVTRSSDNVGNTRSWTYDSLGRCVQALDPAGVASWTAFDDLGRPTLSLGDLDGNGQPDPAMDVLCSWTYDANSRCIAESDPDRRTTLHSYDPRNHRVATRRPDGTETTLVWSPRSNLLRLQDPNGTVILNHFDRLDRCIGRDITPGPGVAASTTFERFAYDGLSRLVGATNNGSRVACTHDSLGHCNASWQDGLPSTASHDALGNRLSLTTPGGLTTRFTYDSLQQPTTLSANPAGQAPRSLLSWAYEGPGRPGRISRSNGIQTRLNWNGAVTPPNSPGDSGWRQVSRVNHQRANGGTVIDQRVATYDSRQNRIRRAQTHPFSAASTPLTNDFAYDPQQRLVQAVDRSAAGTLSASTYLLDPAGHRLQVLANGTPQAYAMDPTPRPGPADFQAGQYTLTPFGAQTWDDNGNLLSRTSSDGSQTAFSYDYANRLVAVLDLSSGAPVPVVTYDYDALGRRIRRTTAGASPLSPPIVTEYFQPAGTRGFILDATQSRDDGITEIRINGSVDRVYVWGGADLAVRLTPTGQPEFFHTDDLGNVLALTDSAGTVLERCDYDPFGVPTFLSRDGFPLTTNAAPSGNPFLAGGQLHDPETGFSKKGYDYWQAQTQLADSAARARTKVVDPFQDVAGTGVLGRALVFWASKKGYDYYMGQGTHHAADAHTNPTFQENQLSGQMPDLPDRHFRTTRLHDNPAFSSPMNQGNMPEMPHRRLNPSNPLHDGSLPVSNPLFDPHAAQSVNRSYRFFQDVGVMNVCPISIK